VTTRLLKTASTSKYLEGRAGARACRAHGQAGSHCSGCYREQRRSTTSRPASATQLLQLATQCESIAPDCCVCIIDSWHCGSSPNCCSPNPNAQKLMSAGAAADSTARPTFREIQSLERYGEDHYTSPDETQYRWDYRLLFDRCPTSCRGVLRCSGSLLSSTPKKTKRDVERRSQDTALSHQAMQIDLYGIVQPAVTATSPAVTILRRSLERQLDVDVDLRWSFVCS